MESRELELGDILDLRAYERARDTYRHEVMALKRRRRVPLGEIMTVVFECFDTVRFQVHEMARVERIASDAALLDELEVYNRLLPRALELSATLFIELTSETELREWLPKLLGVERSLAIEVGRPGDAGEPPAVVASVPEEMHAGSLTREVVTPAVHYLRFPFPADAARRLAGGQPAALVARHPAYEARTELAEETRAELAADVEGRIDPIDLG